MVVVIVLRAVMGSAAAETIVGIMMMMATATTATGTTTAPMREGIMVWRRVMRLSGHECSRRRWATGHHRSRPVASSVKGGRTGLVRASDEGGRLRVSTAHWSSVVRGTVESHAHQRWSSARMASARAVAALMHATPSAAPTATTDRRVRRRRLATTHPRLRRRRWHVSLRRHAHGVALRPVLGLLLVWRHWTLRVGRRRLLQRVRRVWRGIHVGSIVWVVVVTVYGRLRSLRCARTLWWPRLLLLLLRWSLDMASLMPLLLTTTAAAVATWSALLRRTIRLPMTAIVGAYWRSVIVSSPAMMAPVSSSMMTASATHAAPSSRRRLIIRRRGIRSVPASVRGRL